MRRFSLLKILTNLQVWIGVVLSFMTIYYEGKHEALGIFYSLTTYRNLAIGSVIYTLIFKRQYTRHLGKMDIKQTLVACLETMVFILFVWMMCLYFYVGFHVGGDRYSDTLREKYSRVPNSGIGQKVYYIEVPSN
jgi:hypothetical protein